MRSGEIKLGLPRAISRTGWHGTAPGEPYLQSSDVAELVERAQEGYESRPDHAPHARRLAPGLDTPAAGIRPVRCSNWRSVPIHKTEMRRNFRGAKWGGRIPAIVATR
jgi:hypothetical protein